MVTSISTDPEASARRPSGEPRRSADASTGELIAIFMAVLLADMTIYRGHGYSGLAAFLVGAPALLFVGKQGRKVGWPLLTIGAMMVLLAARLVWYGSVLQVAVGSVLLLAFATTLDGQEPFLLNVLSMGSQAIAAGFRTLGEYGESVTRAAPRVHRPGILNLVLPALVFVVFSALFVLANPDAVSFVGRQLEAVVTEVRAWLIRMALRPSELLFWIAVALVTAGLLRPIFRFPLMASFAEPAAEGNAAEAPLFTAFRNTLATAIGLFAIYLAYEFHTLWTRVFPEGFYYAGYAHEGAAWLTVALALATLILSVVFSGRTLRDPRLPRLRRLAWIWSVENLLLSLSVFNRLFIYIDFNGMTRMRIVGLFGISVVVAGFLLVVWKIARGRDFAWLVHRQIWAVGMAIYLFALTPVDWIAANYNVQRILEGRLSACMQIGVQQLDLEGIMALPPLLDAPTPEIREGVAALIAQRHAQLEIDHQQRLHAGRTAYQLSDEIALDRFEAVREKWKAYEDIAKRNEALERFRAFAYQWY